MLHLGYVIIDVIYTLKCIAVKNVVRIFLCLLIYEVRELGSFVHAYCGPIKLVVRCGFGE